MSEYNVTSIFHDEFLENFEYAFAKIDFRLISQLNFWHYFSTILYEKLLKHYDQSIRVEPFQQKTNV